MRSPGLGRAWMRTYSPSRPPATRGKTVSAEQSPSADSHTDPIYGHGELRPNWGSGPRSRTLWKSSAAIGPVPDTVSHGSRI